MDELRRTAKAYYESGTNEERRLVNEFFRKMKPDGSGQVRPAQFREFMRKEGHRDMCSSDFFDVLDIDGSGGLDFYEVMTLYYVIKSGRPFCGQCGQFIMGQYFACMTCLNHATKSFCVCLDCFCDGRSFVHNHGRDDFADNFALLGGKLSAFNRQSRDDTPNRELPSSSTRTHQTNFYFTYKAASSDRDESDEAASSLLALVPVNAREHLTTAHRVLKAALFLKNLVSSTSGCSIM